MKKILISGYYGFNNNGDEAILEQMLDNLRAQLQNVELTVLSHNPKDTTKKYGVRAVDRMNPTAILREVRHCDLLVSGGGSLLQDATSKRSLLYYLAIIRLAKMMGKKVFIYSQGIGPINTPRNRRLTAACLKKADGIVVRDKESRTLLEEIGVANQEIHVTADPVTRSRQPSLKIGETLLRREGWHRSEDRLLVGWAMKESVGEEAYTERQMDAIRELVVNNRCDVVLIPFHSAQDPAVARKMYQRLDNDPETKGRVWLLRGHHTAEEILSVVGNLQILVGVRLHSLIYAAVMGVPMLGISYDPKIDSFLNSLGVEPVCALDVFTVECFMDAFRDTIQNYAAIIDTIHLNLARMKKSLGLNEEIIANLLGEGKTPAAKMTKDSSGLVIMVDRLEEKRALPDTISDVDAEALKGEEAAEAERNEPDGKLLAQVMAEEPAEAAGADPEESEAQPEPNVPDTAFLEGLYGTAAAGKEPEPVPADGLNA